jgi:hypothetical protein
MDMTYDFCIVLVSAVLPTGKVVGYNFIASRSGNLNSATFRRRTNSSFYLVGTDGGGTFNASASAMHVDIPLIKQWTVQAGDMAGSAAGTRWEEAARQQRAMMPSHFTARLPSLIQCA